MVGAETPSRTTLTPTRKWANTAARQPHPTAGSTPTLGSTSQDIPIIPENPTEEAMRMLKSLSLRSLGIQLYGHPSSSHPPPSRRPPDALRHKLARNHQRLLGSGRNS